MGWIANLNNGETIVESRPIPGERTAWQKLLKHCKDDGLAITGMRLTVNGVTVEAMPHKMCDGYFQAYEAIRIMFRDQQELRQGIGSIVGDKVYITWVDLGVSENGMSYVHQEVRPLEEVKIHTTAY